MLAFSKLPGIGKKSAIRMVLHLLRQDAEEMEAFGQAVLNLRHGVKYCRSCHNMSDGELCHICKDPMRDGHTICVVENLRDVLAIENTRQFKGRYHVLGGIISGVHGAREGRRQGAMTWMDRVQMWLWGSYTVTLVLLIVAAVSWGRDPNPFVLLLTGLPTFVTGALIRFRPLMVGGVLFWAIGLVSLFALREYSSLVFAFAIVAGYVVPGILLKRHEDGVRTA